MKFFYYFLSVQLLTTYSLSTSRTDEYGFREYLSKYGFMGDISDSHMSDESVVRNAITLFQDYYKFHPVDGVIRSDMIEFTRRKRCGVSDSPLNFALHGTKWEKSQLTWHFARSTPQLRRLAERAFNMWSNVTNLTFIWNSYNPDILISFKRLNHTYEIYPDEECERFDGNGIVLAHASFPTETQAAVEIHMDYDEDWYYGIDYPYKYDNISFLAVLAHEIGHALGLEHSDKVESIMYSTYLRKIGKNVSLSMDDILGIQNIYGVKDDVPTTTAKVPTSTISTTGKSSTDKSNNSIDLCSLQQVDGMLVVNGRMYVFYKKWVWPMNVGSKNYDSPKLITDWLTFLPEDFKRITAIYQRLNNDVVLIAANKIYQFSVPDLKLRDGWPKSVQETWKLNEIWRVRGLVQTYTGRTFIFYNDNYYAKIDECYFQPYSYGVTSSDFRGIPARFTSVFRYTNGLLYFFDRKNYYEYNEFTNTLIRAGKFSWDLFNIECAKESILDQLKNLLSRLSIIQSGEENGDDDDGTDDE